MKNVYSITKGQLIIAWIFGIILAFAVQDCGYNTSCGAIENAVSVITIFVLIFYTFGWRNNKKKGKLSI